MVLPKHLSSQILSPILVSEGFKEHESIFEAGQRLPKEHSEVGKGQGKSPLCPGRWHLCSGRGI